MPWRCLLTAKGDKDCNDAVMAEYDMFAPLFDAEPFLGSIQLQVLTFWPWMFQRSPPTTGWGTLRPKWSTRWRRPTWGAMKRERHCGREVSTDHPQCLVLVQPFIPARPHQRCAVFGIVVATAAVTSIITVRHGDIIWHGITVSPRSPHILVRSSFAMLYWIDFIKASRRDVTLDDGECKGKYPITAKKIRLVSYCYLPWQHVMNWITHKYTV